MRRLGTRSIAIYDRVIDLCAACVAASVLFLTFGITIEVGVRAFHIGSIDWMLEASEYALLILTFLGAPWALREGAHVRVDLILKAVPIVVAWTFEIVADIVGTATSAILLIWSLKTTLASAGTGSMVYKVLIFPEWWLYALMTVSGLLLTCEFMRRLVRVLRGELIVETSTEMV